MGRNAQLSSLQKRIQQLEVQLAERVREITNIREGYEALEEQNVDLTQQINQQREDILLVMPVCIAAHQLVYELTTKPINWATTVDPNDMVQVDREHYTQLMNALVIATDIIKRRRTL